MHFSWCSSLIEDYRVLYYYEFLSMFMCCTLAGVHILELGSAM